MLWYKSWLETRWRFLIGLALLLCLAGATVFTYPQVMKLMPMVPTNVTGPLGERIREAAALARDYRGYVWSQWFRQNLIAVFVMSIIVNIGMWFERFVIIVIGLHRDFIPANWGFKTANLVADGQTALADIVFLRKGTVNGTVLNGQVIHGLSHNLVIVGRNASVNCWRPNRINRCHRFWRGRSYDGRVHDRRRTS